MKNFVLLFFGLIILSACARWDLDKPIDEETDKESQGNTQPANLNFL